MASCYIITCLQSPFGGREPFAGFADFPFEILARTVVMFCCLCALLAYFLWTHVYSNSERINCSLAQYNLLFDNTQLADNIFS
jgi:hypothetical protein